MATPVVELALQDPVNDQNFFRNGNFYSSFWTTPAGVSCPVNVWTTNASYWLVRPQGAAVLFLRSSLVPDTFSLFTGAIQGAVSLSTIEMGQQINGDLSATLRRKCTFSGYIYNSTGLTVSPLLNIYTANAFNNFSAITLQSTVNLQTVPNLTWVFVSATVDLSLATFNNVANGLLLAIKLPSGAMNDPSKNVLFSRLKFQIGEIATEFVDDTSLFVQAPSVDSTMLQNGCIARPTLFQPNVIPTGAYQAKSINNGDINDGAINGRTLAAGTAVANLGFTPINKAGGDTVTGITAFQKDTVVGPSAFYTAGLFAQTTTTNASNDSYFPAIGFHRNGANGRAIGLALDGRFRTVDGGGTVGYLLDTVTGVDTNSYQNASITYAKLAQSLIDLICPVGIIAPFGGPNVPAGWFLCDGSAVSRTTYSALFSAIGTYWGAGDSISTFNVPDLRGRTPIGYAPSGAAGITARGFATRGGEETHVLSVGELASHAHGVNDSGHNHNIPQTVHHHTYVNPIGAFGSQAGSSQYSPSGTTNTSDSGPGVATLTDPSNAGIGIQANGGNAGHNTMMPFAVVLYIIKAV
jgi:microcystin-dependent protein